MNSVRFAAEADGTQHGLPLHLSSAAHSNCSPCRKAADKEATCAPCKNAVLRMLCLVETGDLTHMYISKEEPHQSSQHGR